MSNPLEQDSVEELRKRIEELETAQQRNRSLVRAEVAAARYSRTRLGVSMAAALLLLGIFINMAVTWYATDDNVSSGFGLIGAGSTYALGYLIAAFIAAVSVIALAEASPASANAWRIVTGLAIVMLVAALAARTELPFSAEARAGMIYAAALPLALVIISSAALDRLKHAKAGTR